MIQPLNLFSDFAEYPSKQIVDKDKLFLKRRQTWSLFNEQEWLSGNSTILIASSSSSAARPMTRMTLTTPTIVARAQKRKMTVATCVSANGKPPSVIRWDTKLKGEATFQETRNQNGTVTVRSNYVLIPSRETHKQKLMCIVTYRNERITDSVVLNVQCKNPWAPSWLFFYSAHVHLM